VVKGAGTVVVFAIAVSAGPAAATQIEEPPATPLTLIWQSAAACDGQAKTEGAVWRLVGREADRAAPITASVNVERVGEILRVTMTTRQLDETGERVFEASSCANAIDAVALVLSVMLSPAGTASTLERSGFDLTDGGEQPRRPGRRRTPAPEPLPDPTPARDPARALDIGIGPRVGGDLLMLPAPTLFGGMAAWVAPAPWRFGVTAAAWVPRAAEEGPRPDSGGLVSLWAVLAEACRRAISQPLWVEGCFGLEAGSTKGTGRGIENPKSASAPWLAVVPAVAVRSASRPLAAIVTLALPVAVVRPGFEIDDFGAVHRAPLVGVRAALGTDWIFP
jgi:hypothetical protein